MSKLKEYLDYYKSLSKPGYALLVTGSWGVGKTYQVKKALKPSERYYVSLFGLESREAIEAALLQEANPDVEKKKKLLKKAGEKANDVGGLYSLLSLIPGHINSLLKTKLDPKKIIIFDDLERSNINLDVLLGTINQFVEHHGSKVVVIAHDQKISSDLQTQKEKIFGHTIKVKPNLTPAFFSFLREIKESNFITDERAEAATRFILRNRHLIFSIFEPQVFQNEKTVTPVNKENSLRVLKNALFDMARLYSIIDQEFIENEEAMSKLITEFCIFNLEYKMGFLSADSISKNWEKEISLRWERALGVNSSNEVPLSELEKLENKYSQISFGNLLLNQKALYQTIVQGHYDGQLLNGHLSNSVYFSSPEKLPAWRRFWSFDDLEDEIVEEAKNELLDQFQTKKILEPNAMLHMFALRFMMSENRIIQDNIETVEESCREYIDDLLLHNALPPRPTDSRWPGNFRSENNRGYGFWVTDAYRDNFNSVHQYLNNARVKAFQNQGQNIAEEIITALKTNTEEFTKLISYGYGGGKYAELPVMNMIDIDEFINAWLTLPKASWQSIQFAFDKRYGGRRLQNDENFIGKLAEEREWAFQLRQGLEVRAENLGGYKGLRVTRIIPEHLTPQEN